MTSTWNTVPIMRGLANLISRSLLLSLVLAVLGAVPGTSQTLSVLYSFSGGTDGQYGNGYLIRDSAGNLYGTTSSGGSYGQGTVFKLTPSGQESVLHSFSGSPDGAVPHWGLIRDGKGNLYGVTDGGGDSNCGFSGGCGIVFKLDSKGNETILYSFPGGNAGVSPTGAVVRDSSGNLYGLTQLGGSLNGGIVFKLDQHNNETVIHNFAGTDAGPDGAFPEGSLIRDSAGNLYGTTSYGGASGWGTVFKVSANGTETILYSFRGGTGGAVPSWGVIRDAAGNLYGTTFLEGAYDGGVVFKIDSTDKETVLYPFGASGNYDGSPPDGGLIRDASGNLYGVAERGGEYAWGTIYKLDPAGTEAILYSFTGGTDGKYPIGSLIRDSAGNLYGATNQGGAYGWGEIFKLKP
jgi:uncharacterized repeat protein (TIGR03803 family)